METSETLIASGEIERIGKKGGLFQAKDKDGRNLTEKRLDIPNHEKALKILFEWLKSNAYDKGLGAAGHRIVHGGLRYFKPHLLTPEILSELRSLTPFAPEHLPHEIKAIEMVDRFLPGIRQIACFDTALPQYHARDCETLRPSQAFFCRRSAAVWFSWSVL